MYHPGYTGRHIAQYPSWGTPGVAMTELTILGSMRGEHSSQQYARLINNWQKDENRRPRAHRTGEHPPTVKRVLIGEAFLPTFLNDRMAGR